MSPRSLVLAVGGRVEGWGRLVRTPGGDWFEPSIPVALVHRTDGRPAPTPWPQAVPVEGADLDAVEQRYERDGHVDGFARIHGRWLGGRIAVERQTPDRPADPGPEWTDPPCPAPAGGWPRIPDPHWSPVPGDLEGAVAVTIFRPAPDRVVVVVAASDVAAVEARWRPELGERLCVVESRWSRRDLDAAHEHLGAVHRAWGLYGWGRSTDARGQAVVTVDLLRVTDEIAAWAEALPAGMVALDPCLRPVGVTGPA